MTTQAQYVEIQRNLFTRLSPEMTNHIRDFVDYDTKVELLVDSMTSKMKCKSYPPKLQSIMTDYPIYRIIDQVTNRLTTDQKKYIYDNAIYDKIFDRAKNRHHRLGQSYFVQDIVKNIPPYLRTEQITRPLQSPSTYIAEMGRRLNTHGVLITQRIGATLIEQTLINEIRPHSTHKNNNHHLQMYDAVNVCNHIVSLDYPGVNHVLKKVVYQFLKTSVLYSHRMQVNRTSRIKQCLRSITVSQCRALYKSYQNILSQHYMQMVNENNYETIKFTQATNASRKRMEVIETLQTYIDAGMSIQDAKEIVNAPKVAAKNEKIAARKVVRVAAKNEKIAAIAARKTAAAVKKVISIHRAFMKRMTKDLATAVMQRNSRMRSVSSSSATGKPTGKPIL